MMNTRKITLAALFIAIGVVSANLVYIPVGFTKCFPVQHALNVLMAVALGTRYALGGAFCIATLRILLGTGSLLAYPGSIIGAFLAGWLYRRTGNLYGAVIGEIFGTGILGALAAYPMAAFLLNSDAGAFFFVMPFLVSTIGGSVIALILLRTPFKSVLRQFIR